MAHRAWRLITKPESLCAQILKARYYPQGNLVDTISSGNASSSWQAIGHDLDLLKKGLIWRVGNGQSIRVWRENWIPHPHSYKPISSQGRCRIRFVSDLLNSNDSWNVELLHNYFLPTGVAEILKIRASPRLGEDVVAWAPAKLGVFSMKSAYLFAFEEINRETTAAACSTPDGSRSCWKYIWSCNVPPTRNFFAWRLSIDSLPAWKNKHKIGLELTNHCPICGMEVEDNFHPFVKC